MRPNLGREGRDPEELGQCPNFHQIHFFKASLMVYVSVCSGMLIIFVWPKFIFCWCGQMSGWLVLNMMDG